MNDYQPPPPPTDPDVAWRTERDRVVREWALGVAARHRDRHWCRGVVNGIEGEFMFGGRVISRDCDARNAALSLVGRIVDAEAPTDFGEQDLSWGPDLE